MLINYKRHQILKILNDMLNSGSNDRITYDFLCKKFNIDYSELRLIKSELTKNKEAVHCGLLDHQLRGKVKVLTLTNSKGLHITDEGINALSNKKYIKRMYGKWLNYIKNIVQVLIPIMMAVIAVTALYLSREDNMERKQEIKAIEDRILLLEKDTVNNTIQIPNPKDSLK